jgi:hypothetical protein
MLYMEKRQFLSFVSRALWRRLREQLRSLTKAIVSFLREGDVALVLHDEREIECRMCEDLDRTDFGLFCGACQCPQTPVSDLRTKWRMPNAACPKMKW